MAKFGATIPQAYLYKGAARFGDMGAVGAGSTEGMKIGVELDFSPSIFIMQQGIKEALDLKYIGKPLWETIDNVFIPSIKKNFNNQGRPQRWKALSPITLQFRKHYGYGPGPILDRSGRLKRAAQAKARWSVDAAKGQAVYGNFPGQTWYAEIQQAGYFPRNITARPFAVIQEQDTIDMENIFRNFISKKLDKLPKGKAF